MSIVSAWENCQEKTRETAIARGTSVSPSLLMIGIEFITNGAMDPNVVKRKSTDSRPKRAAPAWREIPRSPSSPRQLQSPLHRSAASREAIMRPFVFSVLYTTIGSGFLWHEMNWQMGVTAFSIGFWMIAYRH